jgi:hypothetical protein
METTGQVSRLGIVLIVENNGSQRRLRRTFQYRMDLESPYYKWKSGVLECFAAGARLYDRGQVLKDTARSSGVFG